MCQIIDFTAKETKPIYHVTNYSNSKFPRCVSKIILFSSYSEITEYLKNNNLIKHLKYPYHIDQVPIFNSIFENEKLLNQDVDLSFHFKIISGFISYTKKRIILFDIEEES